MRLEVTRKSDLAICALADMAAAAPERLKTADFADRLNAAPAFMAQVLTDLVRLGWVESSPGPTGGYRLLVSPDELSVVEVIEGLEGPTDNDRCVVAGSPCGDDGFCALHDAWSEARSVLITHLGATPLSEVSCRLAGTPATAQNEGGGR